MLFGQSVSIVTLKNAFETHLKNVKNNLIKTLRRQQRVCQKFSFTKVFIRSF